MNSDLKTFSTIYMISVLGLFLLYIFTATISHTLGYFLVPVAVIFSLVPYLTTRFYVLEPIEQLTRLIKNPKHMVIDIPAEYDEIISLIKKLHESTPAIEKMEIRNKELHKLAHTDSLTNLKNRLSLTEDWKVLYDILKNSRMNICFAMVDVDDFKDINDTKGHQAGDDALVIISDILSKTLRVGDEIYRIGGDEFLVVFVNTEIAHASQVMARASTKISNFENDAFKKSLRISVGVSTTKAPFDENTFMNLKHNADQALYIAKGNDIMADKTGDVISIPPA